MSTGAHSSPYDSFAWLYNRWMAEDFCRRALPAIEKLVLSRLPRGVRVLDLCCGTGQMARAIRDRGFQVTGVDASEQMLRLARENAPGIEFLRADARAFLLPQLFAATLSAFNSLAHVETVGELETVFRNVRAALLPGAPFLFDLSMEEAYTSKWRGSFSLVASDHACIVRPSYDRVRRVGRNEITVFHALPSSGKSSSDFLSPAISDRWERSDLCIEQKCHSEAELRAALAAAGFNHVRAYEAQRDLEMAGETGRMFFVAIN